MKAQLNHIAILVKSLQPIVQSKTFTPSELGLLESFESEGTKEIYIGPNTHTAKILLLEPIKAGPYKSALDKRGPSLHHICIDVLNIIHFLETLNGSGWYLHTTSLDFYKNRKQVFLARPGVATLIEINEVKQFSSNPHFIERFSFPFNKNSLISSLQCNSLKHSQSIQFDLYNRILTLDEILNL